MILKNLNLLKFVIQILTVIIYMVTIKRQSFTVV